MKPKKPLTTLLVAIVALLVALAPAASHAAPPEPYLPKDIYPGSSNSTPDFLADVDGTLYFRANDGTNGSELWKSDGTPAGTTLVKDINPGSGSSSPEDLTNVDGTLYFRANDGTNGDELWKSDGTSAGTTLVKDINPGSGSSSPYSLKNVDGTLYFSARAWSGAPLPVPIGDELWKSDGTSAGTTLVKDIYPGSGGSSPSYLTNVDGSLYFIATDPTNGRELWKSDGTPAGTTLVKDIASGSVDSDPENLTNVDGTLYFTAYDGTHGRELWKSDGTPAGTTLVKDIGPGSAWGFPSNVIPTYLTNVDGMLYFNAADPTNGDELWKSDGTSAGTTLVKDINPGSGSSRPAFLTDFDGTLYFSGDGGLWKSDGTAAGTTLVPGSGSSDPAFLIDIGGNLYFSATDPTNGRELWRSDGTAATLIKNINPGSGDSNPNFLTGAGDMLYFRAADPTSGTELWALPTDTTTPDTTIDSGPAGTTTNNDPSFNFSSQTGATFECRLDGPGAATGSFSSCSSPKTYADLADGAYTFEVRAIDLALRLDPTPATRTFTVDATPPQTTIDSGPSGMTNDNTPTFTFSSSDPGSTFECRVDASGYQSCNSPTTTAPLDDGVHEFTVRATDPAGNVDPTPATRSITIDAPPDTLITDSPSGVIATATAVFKFSSTKPGSTFKCQLDGAAWVSCSSPWSYSGLSNGSHSFEVVATSGTGVADPTPAVALWTVDTSLDATPPDTTIDSGPTGITNNNDPSFAFSSEAGASFECRLDGPDAATGTFASCTDSKVYTDLADGSYTFQVRATDSASNTDPTPATRSFTVDTTAPKTKITKKPKSKIKTKGKTAKIKVSFSSETGATFECKLDKADYKSCSSSYSVKAKSKGGKGKKHTISVKATDESGNVGRASTVQFTVIRKG